MNPVEPNRPSEPGPSRPLYDMFTSVPPRYDKVNRAITLGLDVHWRREAAWACLRAAPRRVLDLCCGTGDLAADLAALADPSTELFALDYSSPMLELAAGKLATAGRPVRLVRGDAKELPFPDGYFDCIGIAFAFRNLTYKNPHAKRHLAEMRRVLAPGGRLIIVESSQPSSRLIRACYHGYLRLFVAKVGASLSGNRAAYEYLAVSAERFYQPAEIRDLLREAGFSEVKTRTRLLGAVAIHAAET